jgi:hypothetical protein
MHRRCLSRICLTAARACRAGRTGASPSRCGLGSCRRRRPFPCPRPTRGDCACASGASPWAPPPHSWASASRCSAVPSACCPRCSCCPPQPATAPLRASAAGRARASTAPVPAAALWPAAATRRARPSTTPSRSCSWRWSASWARRCACWPCRSPWSTRRYVRTHIRCTHIRCTHTLHPWPPPRRDSTRDVELIPLSRLPLFSRPFPRYLVQHVIAPLATRPVQSSVRFRPGFALLVLGAVCCFLPFVVALAAQYVLADVVGDPFRRVTPLRCPVRFPCCGGCGSARGGAYAGKSAAPSADRGSSLHPSGSSGIELRRSVRERGAADGERERAAASAALSSALEDALRLAEADGDQSPATPKRRGAGGEAYAESPAVGGEERRLLSESPAPASALKPPAIGKPSAIEKPPVVVHNPVAGAPSVVLSTRELHAADGPRKANEPVPSGGATHVRAAAARFGAKAGSAAAGGGPVAAVSTKNPFASLTAAAPLPANSLSGPSASDRSGTPASDSRLAEKAASTNPFAGLP